MKILIKFVQEEKTTTLKATGEEKIAVFFLTVQKKVAFQFFMSKMYIKINVKNNKTK